MKVNLNDLFSPTSQMYTALARSVFNGTYSLTYISCICRTLIKDGIYFASKFKSSVLSAMHLLYISFSAKNSDLDKNEIITRNIEIQ